MISNIEKAYCMALLEDKIRREKRSADIYLDTFHGEKMTHKDEKPYNHMITRWSTMISAFEYAFETPYFNQY